MDAARLAAVDRADHLSKSANANERALARSEARAGKLQATIDGLKSDAETRRRELNEQLESLRSRLEGAQAESAMTAAALDTARRERSTVAANT
jgi:crescentin